MKKLSLIALLLSGMSASADVISVEFTKCSGNKNFMCALVYVNQTTGKDYKAKEMGVVTANDGITKQINQWLAHTDRTLAMNVEGDVTKLKSTPKAIQVLRVNSLQTKGPRPRGF